MSAKRRNETAGLKTAKSDAPASNNQIPTLARGSYNTPTQNDATLEYVSILHKTHGDDYPVKKYHQDIEEFTNKKICYGTALNLLILAGIRKRKAQKNPGKAHNLQSKNRKGE